MPELVEGPVKQIKHEEKIAENRSLVSQSPSFRVSKSPSLQVTKSPKKSTKKKSRRISRRIAPYLVSRSSKSEGLVYQSTSLLVSKSPSHRVSKSPTRFTSPHFAYGKPDSRMRLRQPPVRPNRHRWEPVDLDYPAGQRQRKY